MRRTSESSGRSSTGHEVRSVVRSSSMLTFAAAFVALASNAGACPTCRDALAAADARWSRGFGYSIAFLLGALILIAGTFTFAVWRATRTPAARTPSARTPSARNPSARNTQ